MLAGRLEPPTPTYTRANNNNGGEPLVRDEANNTPRPTTNLLLYSTLMYIIIHSTLAGSGWLAASHNNTTRLELALGRDGCVDRDSCKTVHGGGKTAVVEALIRRLKSTLSNGRQWNRQYH